jgi:hypothetical protein
MGRAAVVDVLAGGADACQQPSAGFGRAQRRVRSSRGGRRVHLNWRFVAACALPVWFFAISATVVSTFIHKDIGMDVTNYLGATRAWLAGGDPWTQNFNGFAFAAPPATLLAMLPFALLPDPIGWGTMFAAGPILAIAGIRLLHLPWWWIAFPPLVICMCVGNPGAWIPALMFVPPLAVITKVYAALPLLILGRWRPLAVSAAILVATWPILPWGMFIADLPIVLRNLDRQVQHTEGPILIGAVVLAILLIRDRERAAWLSVSTVWPNGQWAYSSIAMPAGAAAAVLSLPFSGAGIVAVLVALALDQLARQRRPPAVTDGLPSGSFQDRLGSGALVASEVAGAANERDHGGQRQWQVEQ